MTSSTTLLAENLNLDLNSPSVKQEIANKFIDLSVCTSNLNSALTGYSECAASHRPPQFWQEPTVIIGGFVVTVALTAALICVTHFTGACK